MYMCFILELDCCWLVAVCLLLLFVYESKWTTRSTERARKTYLKRRKSHIHLNEHVIWFRHYFLECLNCSHNRKWNSLILFLSSHNGNIIWCIISQNNNKWCWHNFVSCLFITHYTLFLSDVLMYFFLSLVFASSRSHSLIHTNTHISPCWFSFFCCCCCWLLSFVDLYVIFQRIA